MERGGSDRGGDAVNVDGLRNHALDPARVALVPILESFQASDPYSGRYERRAWDRQTDVNKQTAQVPVGERCERLTNHNNYHNDDFSNSTGDSRRVARPRSSQDLQHQARLSPLSHLISTHHESAIHM